MKRRKHSPDQIISKLREADVLLNAGQSMSQAGDRYNNAPAESFFASLEKELVNRCTFKTREEARREVFKYIEVFYNRKRLHSALGYMSPEQFEAA